MVSPLDLHRGWWRDTRRCHARSKDLPETLCRPRGATAQAGSPGHCLINHQVSETAEQSTAPASRRPHGMIRLHAALVALAGPGSSPNHPFRTSDVAASGRTACARPSLAKPKGLIHLRQACSVKTLLDVERVAQFSDSGERTAPWWKDDGSLLPASGPCATRLRGPTSSGQHDHHRVQLSGSL